MGMLQSSEKAMYDPVEKVVQAQGMQKRRNLQFDMVFMQTENLWKQKSLKTRVSKSLSPFTFCTTPGYITLLGFAASNT